jgi:hypothetical protein
MSGVRRPPAKAVSLSDIRKAIEPLYTAIVNAGEAHRIESHVAICSLVFIVARYLQIEGYPMDETIELVESLIHDAYAAWRS